MRGELDAETADKLIEVIDSILAEDSHEILRQIASDLVIGLREMRNLTRRIEQECSLEVRNAILFEMGSGTERRPFTVDAYSQTILAQIADSRQTLNLLTYYVMALAEQAEK